MTFIHSIAFIHSFNENHSMIFIHSFNGIHSFIHSYSWFGVPRFLFHRGFGVDFGPHRVRAGLFHWRPGEAHERRIRLLRTLLPPRNFHLLRSQDGRPFLSNYRSSLSDSFDATSIKTYLHESGTFSLENAYQFSRSNPLAPVFVFVFGVCLCLAW